MTYDAIVLGLGGMGAAATAVLARRGLRVLAFDRYQRGHALGSSQGHTRIIRTAYYEAADYVPLCRAAFSGWYDLEQRTGQHLVTACECLTIGQPSGALIQGVQTAATLHGLNLAPLDPATLRNRFPQFRFGDDYVGAIESEAGFLYVDDCVRALQDDALAHRAELRFAEQVLEWKVVGDTVAVRTAWETVSAARLVIAAGAWTKKTLDGLELPLTIMRQVPQWFRPANAEAFRRDRFPIFMAEVPEGHFYGVPMLDPRGMKIAQHYGAPELPCVKEARYDVTPEDEKPIRRFLSEHLPDVTGPRTSASVCLYTLTPDRHFIIDRHPEYPQVAIAGGFSGHGFKFAPVVGEILADLVTKSETAYPVGMFRVGRFDKKN
ncbi:MAG: N-methyl-L-tryptophan oxidase [Gemmataceae bacterium]